MSFPFDQSGPDEQRHPSMACQATVQGGAEGGSGCSGFEDRLQLFKDIVDSVVSGVVVIDGKGNILELNPVM